MTISSSLKFFREGIPLSQKDFCDKVISPSYYAKVESGSSNISADLLLEILKKNNISAREFFFKVNDMKEENHLLLFKEIRKTYYSNDADKLQKLEKINQSLSPNDIFYSVSFLMIQKIKGEPFDYNKVVEIEEELLDTNIWREYHILVFILSTKILSAEKLILVSSFFLKSASESSTYVLYEKDIILSVLNIIQACLEEELFEEARYFIMFMNRSMYNHFYLFEKTLLDFYENIIKMQDEEKYKESLLKCRNIISLLEEYEMGEMPIVLMKFLEDVVR